MSRGRLDRHDMIIDVNQTNIDTFGNFLRRTEWGRRDTWILPFYWYLPEGIRFLPFIRGKNILTCRSYGDRGGWVKQGL